MAYIGQVSALFTASTSGLVKGAEKARSALDRVGKSAAKSFGGDTGKTLDKLTESFGRLPFGIGSSLQQLKTFSTGLSALKTVAGAAGASTGGLGAAAMAAAPGIGAAAAAAAAASAVMYGFGVALDALEEKIETINKASQRMGTSFAETQVLKTAADQNQSSLEAVEAVTKRLSRSIDDLRTGSETAARAFQQLGLSQESFEGLGTVDQLKLVASSLNGIEDQTTKAAVAMDLFGRSGLAIIPVLDALDKTERNMKTFGATLTSVDTKRFEFLGDSFDEAGIAVEALGQNILKPFTTLAEGINGVIAGVAGGLAQLLDPIGSIIADLVTPIAVLGRALGRAVAVITRFISVAVKIAAVTQLSQAFAAAFRFIGNVLDTVLGSIEKVIDGIEWLASKIPFIGWAFGDSDKEAKKLEATQTRLNGLLDAANEINDKYGDKTAAIRKQIDDINFMLQEQAALAERGMNVEFINADAAKRALEDLNNQLIEADPILKANRDAVEEVRKGLDDAAKSAAGVGNALSVNALDEFETTVAELNNSLSLGEIDADAFKASVADARAAFDAEMEKAESAKKLGDKYRTELEKALQTPLDNYAKRLAEIAASDLDPADAIKATDYVVKQLVTDLGIKLDLPLTPIEEFQQAMLALNSVTATSAEQERVLVEARAAASQRLLDSLPDAAKVVTPFEELQDKLTQLDAAAASLNPVDNAAELAEIEARRVRLRQEYADKELASEQTRKNALQKQLAELERIEQEFAGDGAALQGIREKRAAIEKELSEIGAGAVEAIKADRDRINQLLGRTGNSELVADIEAIGRERARAQAAFDEAMASGNRAAADQAEARLEDLKRAEQVANDNQLRRELDAAGIGDLFRPTAEAVQRQQADALRSFKESGRITGEQFNEGLQNLFADAVAFQKEISAELTTMRQEPLKGADVRTSEGIAEYIRLATGREDPALQQRREQLAKLASIETLLREAGVQPVSILGG